MSHTPLEKIKGVGGWGGGGGDGKGVRTSNGYVTFGYLGNIQGVVSSKHLVL